MAKQDTLTKSAPVAELDETLASKSVATQDDGPKSVAVYDPSDYEEGFENISAAELRIPLLVLLQKNSPLVDEDSPTRIESAKAGMLMNSVTQTLFDGKERGVPFIPVHRTHQFLNWVPRDQGGGLLGMYPPEAPEVLAVKALDINKGKRVGKMKDDEGNEWVETFGIYGLLVNEEDGTTDAMHIAFASSQIKHYQGWMTRALSIKELVDGRHRTPSLYTHRYRLKTAFTQNKKGTFYSWAISFDGATAKDSKLAKDSPLFVAAKGLRAIILDGGAKADFASGAGADATEGGGDEDSSATM